MTTTASQATPSGLRRPSARRTRPAGPSTTSAVDGEHRRRERQPVQARHADRAEPGQQRRRQERERRLAGQRAERRPPSPGASDVAAQPLTAARRRPRPPRPARAALRPAPACSGPASASSTGTRWPRPRRGPASIGLRGEHEQVEAPQPRGGEQRDRPQPFDPARPPARRPPVRRAIRAAARRRARSAALPAGRRIAAQPSALANDEPTAAIAPRRPSTPAPAQLEHGCDDTRRAWSVDSGQDRHAMNEDHIPGVELPAAHAADATAACGIAPSSRRSCARRSATAAPAAGDAAAARRARWRPRSACRAASSSRPTRSSSAEGSSRSARARARPGRRRPRAAAGAAAPRPRRARPRYDLPPGRPTSRCSRARPGCGAAPGAARGARRRARLPRPARGIRGCAPRWPRTWAACAASTRRRPRIVVVRRASRRCCADRRCCARAARARHRASRTRRTTTRELLAHAGLEPVPSPGRRRRASTSPRWRPRRRRRARHARPPVPDGRRARARSAAPRCSPGRGDAARSSSRTTTTPSTATTARRSARCRGSRPSTSSTRHRSPRRSRPALRLGWVVAPSRAGARRSRAEKLAVRPRHARCSSSSRSAAFLARGELDRHLRQHPRRSTAGAATRCSPGSRACAPSGAAAGPARARRLPAGASEAAVVAAAAARDVAVEPLGPHASRARARRRWSSASPGSPSRRWPRRRNGCMRPSPADARPSLATIGTTREGRRQCPLRPGSWSWPIAQQRRRR